MVGEGGLAMNFFQHCFPPESRQSMERIPTEVLIASAYRQRFEVSVASECVILIYMVYVCILTTGYMCRG